MTAATDLGDRCHGWTGVDATKSRVTSHDRHSVGYSVGGAGIARARRALPGRDPAAIEGERAAMGVEIKVEDLTKSFGKQLIWGDVTLTIPAGEICVMLGPSGTGKSVLLKTLIGLLKPDNGSIIIEGTDIATCSEKDLYEIRKLFGVLFQDGAMFGSMNLYDNVAFPLREHTKKSESEIRDIVMEKMELVGLVGAEDKLPGEISGGMRKRAGLARALVLDPEIVLFDEPDSGLDPVRTAFLNQLIVDLNAQIDATFLIVTHDINTARTVPDNIGLLYHKHLAMFGPREMLLSSEEPVVRQFLNAQRVGPIGMSEEKDADELEAEKDQELPPLPPIPLQLEPSNGIPRRSQQRARRVVPRQRRRPRPPAPSRAPTPAWPRAPDGASMSSITASRALAPIGTAGKLFAFGLDVGRGLFRRPFQTREFLQQAWFIASVTIIPTALVAIPFGAVIALQVGGLIKQFGAQSFTGSAAVLAVVREAGPIATVPADRRRRRLGHRRRPRRPQDPRGARRDDGARHRPDPAPRRAPGAGLHARRGLPQRPGQRRRRERRLRLQRRPPGRHARRLLGELHCAGPAPGPLARHGQGARLRADRGDRRVVQGHERRWWPEGRR